jgi:hypothetical protein
MPIHHPITIVVSSWRARPPALTQIIRVCEVRAECKLDLDNAPASVEEGKTGRQGGLVIIEIKGCVRLLES